jgi:hypothetical protein
VAGNQLEGAFELVNALVAHSPLLLGVHVSTRGHISAAVCPPPLGAGLLGAARRRRGANSVCATQGKQPAHPLHRAAPRTHTTHPAHSAALRAMSVVVADTGEPALVKKFKPVDCTTNPRCVAGVHCALVLHMACSRCQPQQPYTLVAPIPRQHTHTHTHTTPPPLPQHTHTRACKHAQPGVQGGAGGRVPAAAAAGAGRRQERQQRLAARARPRAAVCGRC